MAQKKQAAKKTAGNNKNSPKAKQVVEEKPQEEVEASDDESDAEEENGVNLDDGSNSEAEGAEGLIDSEAEEDDEEDDDDEDDDDDEEDDEIEPGEVSIAKIENDDSDDEPVEKPISKKEKTAAVPSTSPKKKGGIPKIAIGRIPHETPKEQILFATNLPDDYKHGDVVALFAKFGPIVIINRINSKAGGNHAQIAFESADAVEAALAANEKALTLEGKVVRISRPKNKNEMNERTVVVGLIGPKATKESVSEHFKSCGDIDVVSFSHNKALPTAYVRFKDASSVPKALKLNGSELNSRFITVREESYKAFAVKKPKYTLNVANTGRLESYKSESIEKIFKKYGELVDVDVVCTKSVLAFVTFKTIEQAEKAFKQLNGKTVGDLEIKLDQYYLSSSARTLLVSNLHRNATDEELTELFSECGEIESFKRMGPKALIHFASDDAYCKSFLLNESLIQEQPIFLEPNSILKHKLMQQKSHKYKGPGGKPNNDNNRKPFNKKPFNKRPAQENGSTPTQPYKKARKV